MTDTVNTSLLWLIFHVAVIFMDDRGYVGQPYAAVLLSILMLSYRFAFYAQLAIVGIGDADDQECLLAADFRCG